MTKPSRFDAFAAADLFAAMCGIDPKNDKQHDVFVRSLARLLAEAYNAGKRDNLQKEKVT